MLAWDHAWNSHTRLAWHPHAPLAHVCPSRSCSVLKSLSHSHTHTHNPLHTVKSQSMRSEASGRAEPVSDMSTVTRAAPLATGVPATGGGKGGTSLPSHIRWFQGETWEDGGARRVDGTMVDKGARVEWLQGARVEWLRAWTRGWKEGVLPACRRAWRRRRCSAGGEARASRPPSSPSAAPQTRPPSPATRREPPGGVRSLQPRVPGWRRASGCVRLRARPVASGLAAVGPCCGRLRQASDGWMRRGEQRACACVKWATQGGRRKVRQLGDMTCQQGKERVAHRGSIRSLHRLPPPPLPQRSFFPPSPPPREGGKG